MTRSVRIATVITAGFALAAPGAAKAPTGIKALLGQASDSALSQLEQPGAFYADKAIRIALPGAAKKLSGLMKLTDRAGLTNQLGQTMNDAARLAAGAAKPVFRSAIEKMTLRDGIGIATGGGTAGTDYLQTSSGSVLQGQLRPLVEIALRKTGALQQFEKLAKTPGFAAAGISPTRFTDSVTEQTAGGIFRYMGAEEAKLRKNPLKAFGL